VSDVDILEDIFAKDVTLLEAVRPEQLSAPSPTCPDFDVEQLVNHVVGGVQAFAAGAHGEPVDMAAVAAFRAKDAPAEFRAAADKSLAGWREHGTDREITLFGPPAPGDRILSMSMMEYLTHGIDLALATGQDVPFTDEELQVTLGRAQATLPDEYRGEGKMFGNRIELPDNSSLLDSYLAFMGRRPPA
jgi:uncharacterized protein (TIGR03086 family)